MRISQTIVVTALTIAFSFLSVVAFALSTKDSCC